MLFGLLVTLHVLVCFVLIAVVLLQSGKAADLAGAFGGASQTVFGPRGAATALSKWTAIAAGVFMCTSLILSILANRGGVSAAPSILDKVTKPAGQTAAPGKNPAPAPAAPGVVLTPAPPVSVTPAVPAAKQAPAPKGKTQ